MYFIFLVFIIKVIPTKIFEENTDSGIVLSSVSTQVRDTVCIDEIDSILDYLYEIRSNEKGTITNKNTEQNGTDKKNGYCKDFTCNDNLCIENLSINKRKLNESEPLSNCFVPTKFRALDIEQHQIVFSFTDNSIYNNAAAPETSHLTIYPLCSLPEGNNVETDDRKQFRSLLLDLLKNLMYYRFNIQKLLYNIKCCLYHETTKISKPSFKLQRKMLLALIKRVLMFVKDPDGFVRTDNSIFSSDPLIKTKETRETLNKWALLALCQYNYPNNNEILTIKSFNDFLTNTTKTLLKESSFIVLSSFCNKYLGFGFLLNRYYDMFTCFMYSLYNISMYFDNNLKGIFEKHLSCPPLPINPFYRDYAIMKHNTIFYWLIDWLYYFSNHCKLPTKEESAVYYAFLIRQYPQEFFIQFHLLVYFALRLQDTTQEQHEYSQEFVALVKDRIKLNIFGLEENTYKNYYECMFYNVSASIRDIYSQKIYYKANRHKLYLIRTTEENKQYTDTLEIAMSDVIDKIVNLVSKVMKCKFN